MTGTALQHRLDNVRTRESIRHARGVRVRPRLVPGSIRRCFLPVVGRLFLDARRP